MIFSVQGFLELGAYAVEPTKPTPPEIKEHEATHLPYRSWCRHCVRGRGKSHAHQQRDAEKSYEVPHVSFDYCFLGQEDEKALPVILIRDHRTRTSFSHAVPCKGTKGSSYPARQVSHSIKQLGHPHIIFKSDNEPAILDLKAVSSQILRNKHGMTVIEEQSPVEDHQANGVVERAVQEFGGMARTLNDQLIFNYKWAPPTNHPIYAWLINHASFLTSRFQVGVDGKNPYQRLKGKTYKRPMLTFAEHVHFQPPKTQEQKKNKLAPTWEDGILLSIKDSSNEYFVGTKDGVIKSKDVRRVAESERFPKELLEEIVGVPWEMAPTEDGDMTETLLAPVVIHPSKDESVPPPVILDPIPRQIYIRKQALEKYGHTQGCPRCNAMIKGERTTSLHSDVCRKRAEKAMEDDKSEQTQTRLKETITRRNEYIEKRFAEEIRADQRSKTDKGTSSSSTAGGQSPDVQMEDAPQAKSDPSSSTTGTAQNDSKR